ncbi:unnamed protein product [Lactuca saligna]|uniref:P-loop NTPase domain-containing protein LPA1 homolog n=1 Tax=Lactuca saligna TaxID=75948 RepID=A0AA35YFD3_LACSI|nr:unnamed protein product [Lactuca saligna]
MEVAKLLYIVVEDDCGGDEEREENEELTFRYTRHVLQSTLQLMGCKARHAFKISQRVFEIMRTECLGDTLAAMGVIKTGKDFLKARPSKENSRVTDSRSDKEGGSSNTLKNDDKIRSIPFESYKKRTTVVVKRRRFIDVVCDALAEYKYVGPNQRADLVLACRIRERKESVTVLLCGTSGCGKSTLSALLASRLGITTVVSTDSIRHMMRSFVDEKQNPLLWSSTYHAGEHLDPVAVSEAKAKRKAKKQGSSTSSPQSQFKTTGPSDASTSLPKEAGSTTIDLISPKQMAIEGFKAQSEMVIDSLDRLITAWEERKESVVVEGVHLSLNFVMGLMKKHPSIIPFMIYITNEDKHMERFAVRAKYMTLDPAKNKYVKYIRNIRTIQEYLCNRADKHLVPKVNNTNVDKSVAAIHATVFSCLRRREAGEQLYDSTTNTVFVIDEEYRNQCVANSLSSKGMFQLIQRQGSSRNLMALLNDDGSVAKAWPVCSVDADGKPVLGHPTDESNGIGIGIGIPMYGPLQIGKAEPVNLQFGNFGISAWPSDLGCTSHASSVDESRGELTDNGSRYHSSCCSSPKASDGPSKELKEEQSVFGSDEEVDDQLDVDSDEDLSDDAKEHMHEEMEGSVDEESTKSDEEYDDLAMQDIQENGYFTDDELKQHNAINNNHYGDKYSQNLDRFLRAKSEPSPDSGHPNPSYAIKEKRLLYSGSFKVKRRSHSISCFGKDGPLSPTLSRITATLSPDHP